MGRKGHEEKRSKGMENKGYVQGIKEVTVGNVIINTDKMEYCVTRANGNIIETGSIVGIQH